MIVSSTHFFSRKNHLNRLLSDLRTNNERSDQTTFFPHSSPIIYATPPILDLPTPISLNPKIIKKSDKRKASTTSIYSESRSSLESPSPRPSLLSALLTNVPLRIRNNLGRYRFFIRFSHPDLNDGEIPQVLDEELDASLTAEQVVYYLIDKIKTESNSFIFEPIIDHFDLWIADSSGHPDEDDVPIDPDTRLTDLRNVYDFCLTFSSSHPICQILTLKIDVEGDVFSYKVNGLCTGASVLCLLEEDGVDVGGRALVLEFEDQDMKESVHIPPLETLLSHGKPLGVECYNLSLVVPQIIVDVMPQFLTDDTCFDYVEYDVIKTNSAGSKQVRILGLDSTRIHNILPKAQVVIKYLWKRRKPVTPFRLISDLVDVTLKGKRSFLLKFKSPRGLVAVEYEARSQKDALEITNKLNFLMKKSSD
ncbi:hypothetical protein P9112_001912 [Eukaryota sp. TZLM1-RC]